MAHVSLIAVDGKVTYTEFGSTQTNFFQGLRGLLTRLRNILETKKEDDYSSSCESSVFTIDIQK